MCIQEYSESCIYAYWTFIELHSTKHLILQIRHMSGPLLRSHMLNLRMKKTYPKLSGHGYIFCTMKYSYLINKMSVYHDFRYFVTEGGRLSATCFDRSFGHIQAMNDRYSIVKL
jgi:hypothetical protein